MLASPWDGECFYATFRAISARHSCFDNGLEVHRVEMSPAPRFSMVFDGAALIALRTAELLLAVFDRDDHLGSFKVEINIGN